MAFDFLDLGASQVAKKEEERRTTQQQRLGEITGQETSTLLNAGVKSETDEQFFARKDAICVEKLGEGAQWDEELGDCSVGR